MLGLQPNVTVTSAMSIKVNVKHGKKVIAEDAKMRSTMKMNVGELKSESIKVIGKYTKLWVKRGLYFFMEKLKLTEKPCKRKADIVSTWETHFPNHGRRRSTRVWRDGAESCSRVAPLSPLRVGGNG